MINQTICRIVYLYRLPFLITITTLCMVLMSLSGLPLMAMMSACLPTSSVPMVFCLPSKVAALTVALLRAVSLSMP